MNKDLKRRLYAIALAGVIFTGVKTIVKAETLDDVDMSYVDIDDAIKNLVPDENTVIIPENKEEKKEETPKQEETTLPTEPKTDDVVITIIPEETKENEIPEETIEETKENVEEEHKHTFSNTADDVTNQVTPSCTKGGSYDEVYYCSCGGYKINHVEVAAPGHKWDDGEKKNITESGYEIEYHCTNKGCNETKKEYFKITPEPTKPTEPKPTTPGQSPKTGDESNIALAAIMALGTGIGLFGAGYAANNMFDDKNDYKAKYSIAQKKTKGKYLSKRR